MNEILSRIKFGFGIFIEIEMRKKWVVRQMRFAGNLKENWKGASICCFYHKSRRFGDLYVPHPSLNLIQLN
nr:hypothetical protein Iba_chr14cCG11830 [Ipomoea batatas]